MRHIIVSDFDGTITKVDTLYDFLKRYAQSSWLEIERMWIEGKIGSKECLKKEFELVENLNQDLIDNYLDIVEIDPYFMEFNNYRIKKNLDFIIVSDGIDYFINKVLEKNKIKDIKVISNHGEFINDKFVISFPNQYNLCKNKSGTCKCKVIQELKKEYQVIYIGDGHSDFCVSDKADILYAKSHLLDYAKKNKIKCVEYNDFNDIYHTFD